MADPSCKLPAPNGHPPGGPTETVSDERAEALLRSALEKIVYFEARSGQLEGDAAAARAEADRLRADLGSAASREVTLRQRQAELEVDLARAHRDREELGRVVDALRIERATLVDKLLDAARIRGRLSADDGSFDLAAFISQLRSEALAARGVPSGPPGLAPSREGPEREPWEPTEEVEPVDDAVAFQAEVARQMAAGVWEDTGAGPAAPAPAAAPAERVTHLAEALRAQGRLGAPPEPRRGRAGEETLFGFSVRELSAPDAGARARAAERLAGLGDRAAAPALAAALHAERDPGVAVALLSAFRSLAGPEGAQLVEPFVDAPYAEVRIAALRALVALDGVRAVRQLQRAAEDVDASVRRRAALLALQLPPEQAQALERRPGRDADPEVRRVSALAAGAACGAGARGALLAALDDPAPPVRQAAARSLSRLLGVGVEAVASLEGPARRREIRRLATLPPARVPAPAVVRASRPAPAARVAVRTEEAAPPRAKVLPPRAAETLCETVLAELQTAMRGRSVPELVEVLAAAPEMIESACVLLTARGQVVRRGQRLFVA